MNEVSFTIGDAISFGWRTFRENMGYCITFLAAAEILSLISALCVSWNIMVAISILMELDAPPPDSALYCFIAVYLLIRTSMNVLINKFFVLLSEGQYITMDQVLGFDFLFYLPVMMRLLTASLFYTAGTFFASLIFIFPGIAVNSLWRFYKFLIVEDAETDVVGCLRKSHELSSVAVGHLFTFNVASSAMKLGGLVCLLVGWIPASAVSGLAEVFLLKQLQAAQGRH